MMGFHPFSRQRLQRRFHSTGFGEGSFPVDRVGGLERIRGRHGRRRIVGNFPQSEWF